MDMRRGRKADPAIDERNENVYNYILKHGLSSEVIKITAIKFELSEASVRMAYRAKVKYYKKKLINEIRGFDLLGLTKEDIALRLNISRNEVNDTLGKLKTNKINKVADALMMWV